MVANGRWRSPGLAAAARTAKRGAASRRAAASTAVLPAPVAPVHSRARGPVSAVTSRSLTAASASWRSTRAGAAASHSSDRLAEPVQATGPAVPVVAGRGPPGRPAGTSSTGCTARRRAGSVPAGLPSGRSTIDARPPPPQPLFVPSRLRTGAWIFGGDAVTCQTVVGVCRSGRMEQRRRQPPGHHAPVQPPWSGTYPVPPSMRCATSTCSAGVAAHSGPYACWPP